MNRRWVDTAITKFSLFLIGSTVGLFGLVAVWVGLTVEGRQFPYLNVAFVWSWIISLLMLVPILYMAKTRPAGKDATWGEAMLGATYVFALLFWIYGVVPHQWLTFSNNELAWDSATLFRGFDVPWDQAGTTIDAATGAEIPYAGQGIVEWLLPFDLTYGAIGDIIVTVVYGVGLVANIWLWMIWQNRGKELPGGEIEETSRYGRPLVRSTERVAEVVNA